MLSLPVRLGAAAATPNRRRLKWDGAEHKGAITSSLCTRLPGSGGPFLNLRQAAPLAHS